MKLLDYVTSIETQSGFAKKLGVTTTQVHHWAHEDRPVPIEHSPAIEIMTNGAVTIADLRPAFAEALAAAGYVKKEH
jgi:DNA-binding transcriptional regulator YdaS (Cro superfamily)